jgi:hypothetical protein
MNLKYFHRILHNNSINLFLLRINGTIYVKNKKIFCSYGVALKKRII